MQVEFYVRDSRGRDFGHAEAKMTVIPRVGDTIGLFVSDLLQGKTKHAVMANVTSVEWNIEQDLVIIGAVMRNEDGN